MNKRWLNIIRWGTFGLAIILPIVAWLQYYNWSFEGFNLLRLFGLLGIIAWLIMASHFLIHGLRVFFKVKDYENKQYSIISGYTVLALILLHPIIIYVNQFRIGQGLPPGSLESYVGASLMIFTTLGSLALMLFLAYEVIDKFKGKKIYDKYYFWIFLLQFVAMGLIFVHANNLGYITQSGWLQVYWWLNAGLIFVSAFITIPKEYSNYKSGNS